MHVIAHVVTTSRSSRTFRFLSEVVAAACSVLQLPSRGVVVEQKKISVGFGRRLCECVCVCGVVLTIPTRRDSLAARVRVCAKRWKGLLKTARVK